MPNKDDYDKVVRKWTKKAVAHFFKHRDILAFLLPRVSSESWLVREYGYAIRSLVKDLEIDGEQSDIFFETGCGLFNERRKRTSFDLLILPKELVLSDEESIRERREKAIILEFKVGTLDRKRKGAKNKEILGSSALVQGFLQDKKKIDENGIKNAYIIGFLYTCNKFLQTKNQTWRALNKEKGETFIDLRNNVINEISSNDGIELLDNDDKLIFKFSNGDVFGKACFLVYKIKRK